MTQVNVLIKSNFIYEVELSGHAFYSDYGQDIVCSAISVLCYTIANKILDLDEEQIDVIIKEGYFKIIVNKYTHDTELLLETLIMGLTMIEEQYKEEINIKEDAYV